MPRELISKYQLSGIDERDRGFGRQIHLQADDGQYIASLRYEKIFVETDGSVDEASAIEELVKTLHQMGYAQLQTQRSFSGVTYLGTQEACVDYPDPERPEPSAEPGGLVSLIRRIFMRV